MNFGRIQAAKALSAFQGGDIIMFGQQDMTPEIKDALGGNPTYILGDNNL
jgi:hypothetical protein